MRYMGSKASLVKEIVPIIQGYVDAGCEGYYEPFVGGGNVIDKIRCDLRVGADVEPYVISCLDALGNGWDPPKEVSEELYKDIQRNRDKYSPELVGYVGYQLSYGGKFFGGYRRDKVGKRNYSDEAYRYTYKQIPLLGNIKFICKDYRNTENLTGYVIYCDPPYKDTTTYSTSMFNYDEFYEWCHKMAKCNTVLISEVNMPEGFDCIWSKEVKTCLDCNRNKGKRRVEKLFIPR